MILKQKFYFNRIILALFLLSGLSSCIDEIRFDNENEPINSVSIDAHLIKDAAYQKITFRTSSGVGSNEINYLYPSKVNVVTDRSEVIKFERDTINSYLAFFNPEFGTKYKLQFEIDGIDYSSTWEEILPVRRVDSLYYEYEKEEVFENNISQDKRGYQVYGNFVQGNTNDYFASWQTFSTYEVRTLLLEDCCFRCWLNYQIQPNSVKLAESDNDLFQLVYIPFSQEFSFNFRLKAVQYSLSATAFEYWSDVETILSQNGSIFDASPFRVMGNVSVDDENEKSGLETFGYFYLSDTDTTTLFIERLGIEGLPTPYTPIQEGNCLELYPGSYGEIPDGWPN